jgi:hypothetical protein
MNSTFCCFFVGVAAARRLLLLFFHLFFLFHFGDMLKVLELSESLTNTIYGSWWWIKELCEPRIMARLFPFHIRRDWQLHVL